MNITKIKYLLIVFAIFTIIPLVTSASDIQFSGTYYPDFDTYLKNGNWYNTSIYMLTEDQPGPDNEIAVSVMQWNITVIPDHATIDEVSLTDYVHYGWNLANSFCQYNNITSKPNGGVNYATLKGEAAGGKYYTYENVGWSSPGWCVKNTTAGKLQDDGDIIAYLQGSLDVDWFAVGHETRVTSPTNPDIAMLRSMDYVGHDGTKLWVLYTLTDGPFVNNTSPVDGTSDTTCNPFPTGQVIQADLYHLQGGTFYTTAWLYNDTTSTWDNETYVTGTNQTWLTSMEHACNHGQTYQWYIEMHDGTYWYNTSVMSFTTEDIDPPTGITCTRNSSSSLNISFTPDTGANWSTILYREGANPTEAVYDGSVNTTNSYYILEGITPDHCYGLKLRSVENITGDASISSWANKNYGDCCLWGNVTDVYIRYENTSSDGQNNLIDLSEISPCANHILEVTYVNLTREQFVINVTNYATYPISINLNAQPLYYTLEWNATTINDSCSCSDLSPNYKRRLLAESLIDGTELTFYMITDRDVYADYNCTGSQITTFKHPLQKNNLARYDYQVTDDTGLFSLYTDFNSYISFNSSNSTVSHIIHQQFLFDDLIIDDVVLLYDKTYCVSALNSLVSPSAYANIMEVKTDNYVTPNINSIIIPYREISTDTYNDEWDIRINYAPGGSGVYVYFDEGDTNKIWRLYCEMYDYSDGSLDYSSAVLTNNNNFSFVGGSHSKSYFIIINISHTDYNRTASITFWLSPEITEIINYGYVENILSTLFGDLPGNLDDPTQTINWMNAIIFFIALIPLSLFGAVNPGLAGIGVGFWFIGATIMFNIVALTGIGVLLIVFGVIYIFGRRRS